MDRKSNDGINPDKKLTKNKNKTHSPLYANVSEARYVDQDSTVHCDNETCIYYNSERNKRKGRGRPKTIYCNGYHDNEYLNLATELDSYKDTQYPIYEEVLPLARYNIPSPVSSSYAELQNADGYNNFKDCPPQASNLYGSIYEPINSFNRSSALSYAKGLEKCCICQKPIINRILKATGRPYHADCFRCVVCAKSLDRIQFTVDTINQIYCIDDYNKLFAPRCSVCHLPIYSEDGKEEAIRYVCLDRSFHTTCFKCEDCGRLLKTESEDIGCYPLDDHILCQSCNAIRIQILTSKIPIS